MADVSEARYGARLAGLDPASLGSALATTLAGVARDPSTMAAALADLARAQAEVGLRGLRQLSGDNGSPPHGLQADDRRFADRAWRENPFLRTLLESYLASSLWARRLLDAADVPAPTRTKARFMLSLIMDGLAPSNVPWLNPTVVKEAIDTGGLSLARGFRNFLTDAVSNDGLPRQVDSSPFELGRNLAATPGRVVLRNDVMELLLYEPQTPRVHAEPIVYSPSWINKYYVLDLAPGRSFVEHAVQQGFTVFAISYRNPDTSMADTTLDDYLRDGLFAALDHAARITGSERVNILAVCIGGTLATLGLAVLAARGEADRVGWATLLNTLVDYSDPGEIGVFTDEATVERIEQRMQTKGYLQPTELAGPFTWMRANDLVWRYVVSNWYVGKDPPAFDVLAWNADSTRLPAAMHAQFLRACYLENRLVEPGAFELDGTPVDVSKIETPLYVLGSQTDHIAPWRPTYRTTQLVSGEASYTLASSGHIVGMVSPPGNDKAAYRTNEECPADADEWLRGAEEHRGSWWEHWSAWAAERSGDQVEPPASPPGEPAPGSYVRG